VQQLLTAPRTTFVVVSTLEAAPSHEARYLARELTHRDLHLGAIVANRVLPASFTAKASAASARKLLKLTEDGDGLVDEVAATLGAERSVVGGVLREISTRFHDLAVVAAREAERRAELATLCPLVVTVPVLDRDVNDLGDLFEVARHFDGVEPRLPGAR
jgi:anion-transporting  ArsA/GET3 family ATPase